jgi:ElaB/YqjD/DUF883 family membrane-anchored ribosome-binding protein
MRGNRLQYRPLSAQAYLLGMFIFLSFVSTSSFLSPSVSCTLPTSFVQQRLGFHAFPGGSRANLLPFKLRGRSRLHGVLATVSVLDKMFKDFSSGISDMLGGANANDVAQLRGALGDAEFSAVKATISKLMAKQREEMRELQNRNLEQARQMQRELNQYSNKYSKGFTGPVYRVDLNNDGVKDLIYSVKNEEDPFKISLTESSSFFINENGVYLPVSLSSYSKPSYYVLNGGYVGGDFNGDGYDDVATFSADNSSRGIYNLIAVLLNKGLVSSTPPPVTSTKPVNFNQELGRQIFDGREFDLSTLTTSNSVKDTTLTKVADNSWKLVNLKITNEVDYLVDIDRVLFKDTSMALDLNGNAGTTAKILGAVFGKDSLSNKQYVGIGLSLLDAGMSTNTLSTLAVDAANLKTNDQIVSTLWKNVFGTTASISDKAPYVKLLDDGMSAGTLAWLAADTTFNKVNINLVGLAQTGIEYIPVN